MCKNRRQTVHSNSSAWGEAAPGLGEGLQRHAELSCVSLKHLLLSQCWGKLFLFRSVALTRGLGGPGLDYTRNVCESPSLPGPWVPVCWSRLSPLGLAELQPRAPTAPVAPAVVWVGLFAGGVHYWRGDEMTWEGQDLTLLQGPPRLGFFVLPR